MQLEKEYVQHPLGSFRIPNGIFHASGNLNSPEWLHDLGAIKEQITIL